ncbi:hypothetical protein FNT36_05610 [Hymenobacter setariae]|uniref:Photosynthesis system II assembly factor Ycf48/Hcf136-like domain-containing protein n=1 Tax=Hymenobacter setariae TaxID=2594794 RepID=A0A558C4J5_9BACT|nr:hypothetical protein [Hymenobacter setariae]TVT43562.1 hypothetical protein FNT36_05610 [Hymenobacter setariae]
MSLLLSCTMSNPAWRVVQGSGLVDSQDDFSALLLPTSTTGLLLGSQWPAGPLTAQKVAAQEQALIQRSVDHGNSWQAQQFGRGRFVWAQQVGPRTYALKLVGASGQERSVIYRSDDAGANWQELGQVAEGLKSLLLVGDIGYAVGYRENANGSNVLFKTRDGGKTWRAFQHALPRFVAAAPAGGNSLAFLLASAEQPTDADRLALVDATSFDTTIEPLRTFHASTSFADTAGNLWFLTAPEAGRVRLVARDGVSGRYQEVGVFKQSEPLMAEAVYVSRANAYVVLSSAKAYLNAYKFFHGRLVDGRWSWQEEALPIDYTFGCYGFYPDGQCYIYALAGRLLVRN